MGLKTLSEPALQAAQKKEFGEQVAATAALESLWDEVDEMYIKTLKVARVAFKEDPRHRNASRTTAVSIGPAWSSTAAE